MELQVVGISWQHLQADAGRELIKLWERIKKYQSRMKNYAFQLRVAKLRPLQDLRCCA